MDKQTAIDLAGGQGRLAELLGITTAAVSQWDDFIPEAREWQLKVLRPDWFSGQKQLANVLKVIKPTTTQQADERESA